MGVFDKVREFAEHLSESDDAPAKSSPAGASGGSGGPGSEGQGGQVSEAGSSFDDPQAAFGGADAVPGTPDATPSTRLGGEDDQQSEDVASIAPSESVAPAERDDV